MTDAMTRRLRQGQAFHQEVQAAFRLGLLGASAAAERVLTLTGNRNGRVDLVAFPEGPERMVVLVEIKCTDWDAMNSHRVRPNLRRHLRQLQRYLDQLCERIGAGDPGGGPGDSSWTLAALDAVTSLDSISPAIVYPHRPADGRRARLIEQIIDDAAVQLVWYDETDWKKAP